MDNRSRWIPLVVRLGDLMIVLGGTLLRPQPQGAHEAARAEAIGAPATVEVD